MKKTSVELQPRYIAKSRAGTIATAVIMGFGIVFAVMGIFLLVRGSSSSTEMSQVEVLVGGFLLIVGAIGIPLILRSNWRKTVDNSVEFMNSISDSVRTWAVLRLGSQACQACCELLDGYYLELTLSARRLNAPSFTIYRFLSTTQTVPNKPLLDMGSPKKHILPMAFVPLDADGFQKWKVQKEKWKSMIAEDDELREQILANSLRHFMMEYHKLLGIISIEAAGYEKYLMHPQLNGQYLHGKALGVSIIFYKSKPSATETPAGFETPQIANAQLVHIGKRILEHITEEMTPESFKQKAP